MDIIYELDGIKGEHHRSNWTWREEERAAMLVDAYLRQRHPERPQFEELDDRLSAPYRARGRGAPAAEVFDSFAYALDEGVLVLLPERDLEWFEGPHRWEEKLDINMQGFFEGLLALRDELDEPRRQRLDALRERLAARFSKEPILRGG